MQTSTGAPVRKIIATVLVVLTALLSIITLIGGYVRGELLTTDGYVAIVGPLARDPAIQAEVVDAATAAVVDNVRVDDLVRNALEPLGNDDRLLVRALNTALSGLGPLLQNQLESAARRAAERVVTSDRFADLWVEANRRGHAATLAALRDEGSVLRTTDGEVAIDLSVIVEQVKQRLVDDGLTLAARIPTVDRQIVLIRSAELAKAQGVLRLVDRVGPWLPWLSLVFAAGAIAVASRRRRTLVGLGIAVAAAMTVCAIGLTLARGVFLDRVVSTSFEPAAAAAVADAALGPLWERLWLALVASALIGLVAWLAGPAGDRIRGRFSRPGEQFSGSDASRP